MTYEQKLMACKVIAPAYLEMSRPQWWHVIHSVEIKSGVLLKGRFGAGIDPQSAIEDHWRKITALEPHEYIVTSSCESRRKAYRWAEFMWVEVDEKAEADKMRSARESAAQNIGGEGRAKPGLNNYAPVHPQDLWPQRTSNNCGSVQPQAVAEPFGDHEQ